MIRFQELRLLVFHYLLGSDTLEEPLMAKKLLFVRIINVKLSAHHLYIRLTSMFSVMELSQMILKTSP